MQPRRPVAKTPVIRRGQPGAPPEPDRRGTARGAAERPSHRESHLRSRPSSASSRPRRRRTKAGQDGPDSDRRSPAPHPAAPEYRHAEASDVRASHGSSPSPRRTGLLPEETGSVHEASHIPPSGEAPPDSPPDPHRTRTRAALPRHGRSGGS